MAETGSLNMIQALGNALDHYLERDETAVVLGEDVGGFGGVFRVTAGLQEKYGSDRVFDTPLAEAGIVGMAIGMGLGGLRPIVEIQFADFIFPAFDQIVNELAKYRYRSGGQYAPRVMIRTPYGGGIRGGHYHSQSPEAYFAHTPGLRVVVPSGPYEAKGLLLGALECADPVIFLEPKRIYRAAKGEIPLDYYTLPLERAQLVRKGEDITLVAWGAMLHTCQEAVALAEGEGYDVELIDLQSIVPYDLHTLVRSVTKTGRMVVVHEAPMTCGFGAELVAAVQAEAFDHLRAPLLRITGFDTPFPYSLEDHYLPSAERILRGLVETIEY
ncbi:MAG: alpha-ketoacid dehydrogenase subunit beta [bacterium]|nr:alpha-ketoacid dehydrogenase subunit beta [bacterium]